MKKIDLKGTAVMVEIDGQTFSIGDLVKVTRFGFEYKNSDGIMINVPYHEYVGELRLHLKKGLVVCDSDGICRRFPITKNSRNPYKWELLKKYQKKM